MKDLVVERDLEGIGLRALVSVQARAAAGAAEMREAGRPVLCVHPIFTGRGRRLCLFEADDLGDVEQLNRERGLPYVRVH